MTMHYENISANDFCPLAYQTSIRLQDHGGRANSGALPSKLVLLLHGFSGSSAYFCRNFAALSTPSGSPDGQGRDQRNWVIAPDMRGHGHSGRPKGGYHVARLASDLRNLVNYFNQTYFDSHMAVSGRPPPPLRIVAVGCSIGAAILWTYIELFGNLDTFSGLVFVDQAPLQDAAWYGDGDEDNWDETMHHKGCFDEASLKNAQRAWMLPHSEIEDTYKALVGECLGYNQEREDPSEERPQKIVTRVQANVDEKFFAGISKACDGKWLARLMADHTRYDHREAIEMIDVPALVMAGGLSGCFPLEGMLETARRIKKGQAERGQKMPGRDVEVSVSVFDDSGHWLFYEDAERFNREILAFVGRCIK